MDTYRNILIVRTDRIGDVVLTTPAVRALREHFRQARLTMLVTPLTRDLVLGNPSVDEVLVDDRLHKHRGPQVFKTLVREIRGKRFDLAINYHTKKRTNALCFLAGIPRRIGYKNKKWGFLLSDGIPDDRHLGLKHESRYCLDLLAHLGVEPFLLETTVPLQPDALAWSREILGKYRGEGKRVIVIHPQASCPTKKWPGDRFVALMQMVREKYPCFFVLIGAVRHDETAERMAREFAPDVLDLTGQTSVAQLAALLKGAQLLISNDSGPVHVAAGVGTPVVSIFTRNQPGINPERWKPLGPKSRYVAPPVDLGVSFARGVVEDPVYLEKIAPRDVLEEVDALFKLC